MTLTHRQWILVAAAVVAPLLPLEARAQHGDNAPLVTRAPREASQYDFLIGQWEVVVTPRASGLAQRIHGVPRLRGSWKATRGLDGWGIEDELHIADASGNPRAFTHFVRLYDPTQKRWIVSAVDVYRQQMTQSTAQWLGSEMVSQHDATDASGTRAASRVRITAITPTSFHYQQDRSPDGGKTWDEGLLVMDAKRVGSSASAR
jgi:hypothetical protein